MIVNRIAVAAAGALAMSACVPILPPIAAEVAGDAAFKSRIATTFPPGSRSAVLRAELEAEGFRVYDDLTGTRHTATYAATFLPCDIEVRVDWTEDRRGRIARIQAQRHDCS